MEQNERACVHYYFGDGNGKSTAAFGLSLRAAGAGKRVVVAQFLKGLPYAELASFEKLGIAVYQTPAVNKFVFQMNDEEKAAAKADCERVFGIARAAATSGDADVVVLDEVTDAVACGMLEESALLSLLPFKFNETIERAVDDTIDRSIEDMRAIGTRIRHQKADKATTEAPKDEAPTTAPDDPATTPPPLPIDKEDPSRFMPK